MNCGTCKQKQKKIDGITNPELSVMYGGEKMTLQLPKGVYCSMLCVVEAFRKDFTKSVKGRWKE